GEVRRMHMRKSGDHRIERTLAHDDPRVALARSPEDVVTSEPCLASVYHSDALAHLWPCGDRPCRTAWPSDWTSGSQCAGVSHRMIKTRRFGMNRVGITGSAAIAMMLSSSIAS